MKKTNQIFIISLLLFFAGVNSQLCGQVKEVVIHQDSIIQKIVSIKKEIDTNRYTSQYYTIQLYYGNYTKAQRIVSEFKEYFPNIETSLVFETPNYKVRIARLKDLEEVNILLEKIKKIYPGAFVLEPNN